MDGVLIVRLSIPGRYTIFRHPLLGVYPPIRIPTRLYPCAKQAGACNTLAILVSTLQCVGRNLQAMSWCSDLGQASSFACLKNGCRSVGARGLKLFVLQRAFVSLKQVS
jgi:hypothetical protein